MPNITLRLSGAQSHSPLRRGYRARGVNGGLVNRLARRLGRSIAASPGLGTTRRRAAVRLGQQRSASMRVDARRQRELLGVNGASPRGTSGVLVAERGSTR